MSVCPNDGVGFHTNSVVVFCDVFCVALRAFSVRVCVCLINNEEAVSWLGVIKEIEASCYQH